MYFAKDESATNQHLVIYLPVEILYIGPAPVYNVHVSNKNFFFLNIISQKEQRLRLYLGSQMILLIISALTCISPRFCTIITCLLFIWPQAKGQKQRWIETDNGHRELIKGAIGTERRRELHFTLNPLDQSTRRCEGRWRNITTMSKQIPQTTWHVTALHISQVLHRCGSRVLPHHASPHDEWWGKEGKSRIILICILFIHP